MRYVIHVGEDIDPATWLDAHPLPIAGRRMNDYLHAYFDTELARTAPPGASMNKQSPIAVNAESKQDESTGT
ncbi:hypothetical protein FQZ97_1057080 [compost metagenome]